MKRTEKMLKGKFFERSKAFKPEAIFICCQSNFIFRDQEQRAQLHLVLSRWRKAMEQKYPSKSDIDDDDQTPRVSPRSIPCRYIYGDVTPKIRVHTFPHAVRLWQIYLK